jgi:hypothetical protein
LKIEGGMMYHNDYYKGVELGEAAYKNGLACIPALDPEVLKALQVDGVEGVLLLRGWHRGWAQANIESEV